MLHDEEQTLRPLIEMQYFAADIVMPLHSPSPAVLITAIVLLLLGDPPIPTLPAPRAPRRPVGCDVMASRAAC